MRNRFDCLTSLAPCAQPADDYKCLESMFLKQLRHTGAGGFALSSTVEIDFPVAREFLNLFFQVVGFEAD
jgi:hypothetical protein